MHEYPSIAPQWALSWCFKLKIFAGNPLQNSLQKQTFTLQFHPPTTSTAVAVMFTFSFSSAFAATYTLEDHVTALSAEKTAQLGYINNIKTQYVNSITYDDEGFTQDKYMKAAYEAAAAEVVEDADKAMQTAIDTYLDSASFDETVKPDKTVVTTVAASYNNLEAFRQLVLAKRDTLNKAQAPLTKAYVEGKVTVDVTKYNSTDKVAAYGDLTTAQYVQKCMDEAADAIKTADKQKEDTAKIAGYWAAKAAFDKAMTGVKTLDDEKFADEIGAGTVDAAVEQYAKNALDAVYAALDMDKLSKMAADDTENLQAVAEGPLKAFWEADTKDAKKGEFFGVAVANITKVTRAEVAAISTAYKAAVAASKAPVKAYANGDAAKINCQNPTALQLLARASKAVEKYADVVKYADKLKSTYVYGIKQYDDAKVNQAVKAAEQLVYDDMASGNFQTEKAYLDAAAAKEGITLEAQNFELQKFEQAMLDAAKKLYKDAKFDKGNLVATVAQEKVSYGDNKTAEEDLVYLRGTYAVGTEWDKIAVDVIADLNDAQSYDEIKTIMAKAAEDFGKLLKAADAKEVADAQASYEAALENYKTLKYSLADKDVYKNADIFDAAVVQGKKLINDAVTVDGVKAAFEEAKALIDNIKTSDELKAAKEAVEKQIAALPYTAKLTEADKAAVKAAYDAYDAYKNMAGATEIDSTSLKLLKDKYNKVNSLAAEAIDAKAKALNKQIDDLGYGDADVAAKAALKADVDAVKAEAKALNEEIKAVNDDYTGFLNTVTMAEVDKLPNLTSSVVDNVYIKLVNASKDGASYKDMTEAMDAYNALTDRQKYEMTDSALPMVKVLEQKLAKAVTSLKIKASSKATKGAMTIKWRVIDGDKSAAAGYQVWRSTKANKGFKKMITTKKMSYKNTKGLKKGTTYYYRVRAYAKVDGKLYFSDFSNKAYRKAK